MTQVISGVIAMVPPVRFVGFLKVETDSASERFQVFDRNSGQLLWHQRTDGGQTVKRVFPLKYVEQEQLLCVLLDDNKEHNAAVIDNVSPQTIDANDFDMASA